MGMSSLLRARGLSIMLRACLVVREDCNMTCLAKLLGKGECLGVLWTHLQLHSA